MSVTVGGRAVVVLALVVAGATGSQADRARSPRKQAQRSPAQLEPRLVIGEFRLTKVVDGDTIKVSGLDSSLRLLGIDTEETFKSAADRRAAAAGLGPYMTAKRGAAPRPVKMATPMGEQAKDFAERFFAGVDTVRLERDHPAERRDRYNRILAYVFVKRDGAWLSYNVACVRAGMAPYFPKYGRSRRFHADFVAAEAEAKREQLGIWAPGAPGYPDYPEREAWWAARGDFVEAFRTAAEHNPSYVDLTHDDAMQRLEALVGTPVVVLGIVGDVTISVTGPSKVTLARRVSDDFPLVFFDRGVLTSSGISAWRGEPAMVSGTPTMYENKRDHRKQLQLVIERATQVRLAPLPGLAPPTTREAP